jgi:hypothetical protein
MCRVIRTAKQVRICFSPSLCMQQRERSCSMMNDLRTPMSGLNKPVILKQITPLMPASLRFVRCCMLHHAFCASFCVLISAFTPITTLHCTYATFTFVSGEALFAKPSGIAFDGTDLYVCDQVCGSYYPFSLRFRLTPCDVWRRTTIVFAKWC